jgi:hypothetical protein
MYYPQGWSWTVETVDMRGYARIPADCSARLGVNYFFSEQENYVSSHARFNGPVDNNYQLHTLSPIESFVWSNCSVARPPLNMNTQIIINCTKDAIVRVDSQEGNFKMLLHLLWKKCERVGL